METISPLLLVEMPFDFILHLLSVLVSHFRGKGFVTSDGRDVYSDNHENGDGGEMAGFYLWGSLSHQAFAW